MPCGCWKRGGSRTACACTTRGAFHSAEEAAGLLGVAAETVYETLVVLREPPRSARTILVMVPAERQVDLKLLARELGEKKLRMATRRETEALTGLEVGGICALAGRKPGVEIFLDASASALDHGSQRHPGQATSSTKRPHD